MGITVTDVYTFLFLNKVCFSANIKMFTISNMSNVTFKSGNVMSSQLASKTGNLSQLLFRQNEKKSGSNEVKPLAPLLEKTNPYEWNTQSLTKAENGESQRFNMYMDQARMSTYYQDNPWEGLQHSNKHGYQGPTLGGEIRGNIPPGYLPGNTLTKPNRDISSQMNSRNTIEGFGNISYKNTKNINWR